jgi:hypothetical protein
MDKKHCAGCYNNYYNYDNRSDTGECWLLRNARLVMRKKVPSNQRPPWNQPVQSFPHCYRAPGYAFVEPGVGEGRNRT